ncbi:MAG: hypothetical protein ACRBDX_09550 [Gammaproteobacteria bacterium]
MSESNVSDEIYKEFHQISRTLTFCTVAIVAAAALIVWLLGIDVGGKRTSLMGVAFMLLAFFTYQIPYICYRYLLYKYKNESQKRSAVGYDWKHFRDQAMQHR